MLEPDTRVQLTKGYRGEEGTIVAKIDSRFEFYVVRLENGMNIVVGPSAFVRKED